jgi:hypothetical protein
VRSRATNRLSYGAALQHIALVTTLPRAPTKNKCIEIKYNDLSDVEKLMIPKKERHISV